MSGEVHAAIPPQGAPERRLYPDATMILNSINSLKEDLGREMREVKTTLAAMSDKHQGLHMDFARHETEVKVRVSAIEQNQSEAWDEIRKVQGEVVKVNKNIEDHLTATAVSKNTKKGIGDNAKYILSTLFGSGIVFVLIKLIP